MITQAFEEKNMDAKKTIKLSPTMYEPYMSNRFSIEFPGLDISEEVFQKYKLYIEDDKFIFETNLIDFIPHQLNPIDLLQVCKVNIHHLDPTGAKCGGYSFRIKGIYYEVEGDYSKDNLLTHKIKGIIEENTFHLIYEKNKQ